MYYKTCKDDDEKLQFNEHNGSNCGSLCLFAILRVKLTQYTESS